MLLTAPLHRFSVWATNPAVLLRAAGRKWHECPHALCTVITSFTSTVFLMHSVTEMYVVHLNNRLKPMRLYWPAGFTPLFPPQGRDWALMVRNNTCCSVQRGVYSSRSWLNQLAGGNPSRATVSSVIPHYRGAQTLYCFSCVWNVLYRYIAYLMNCTECTCSLYWDIKVYSWDETNKTSTANQKFAENELF